MPSPEDGISPPFNRRPTRRINPAGLTLHGAVSFSLVAAASVSLPSVLRRLAQTPTFQRIHRWAGSSEPKQIAIQGLAGSLPAFLLRHVSDAAGPWLCVMPTEDAAAYLASDLDQLFGEERLDEIVRFPASGLKPYDTDQVAEPAAQVERSDVLQRLSEEDFQGILVTSAEALYETIPAPETLEENTYTLRVGEEIEPAALVNRLVDDQFSRVEYVQEPGDVARRGGIVDVYPFSGDYPVRIEFFGDEVDSIREFDPVSQRSISRRNSARLVPNLAAAAAVVGRGTLFDYLPEALHLFLYDADLIVEDIQARYDRAVSAFAELESDDPDAKSEGASPSSNVSRETSAPHLLYVDSQRFEGLLAPHPALIAGSFGRQRSGTEETLTFAAAPQPAVNGRIALIRERLQDNTAAGIDTWIVCDSRGQQSRLRELLDLNEPPVLDEDGLDEDGFGEDGFGGDGTPSLADTYGGSFDVRLVVESLHEGFEAPVAGVAVYTDHQLFGRYHRPTRRKRAKQLGGLSLNELRNLKRGDFVVHIDYGIGRFDGMAKREVRGKEQEVVKVLYHGDDALYVNVNALHKLHKYTGKEGHQPRLTKLGSGAWERKKARTKKRVKDIARDLIKLYAARKSAKGFAFSEDSVWQREMEASFPYVDTPDQAASAEAVKDDMEQPIPMDRLVCGDVGFGKTEIAVRAAFKAVQDGKQVAVLVPTTILADQHFQTFSRRLGPYPVVVEVLSRFRTAEESRDVVKRLKEGKVDILIGTQRIVSKDVAFKDIGLLIVDEEQRFGVKAKEKLRKLRANIDTLTLTATPIPRTLQFSLLGARDLSIIRTPPPNRQPIVTEIHTYDTDLIRDAILYEVNRGGQVYFIHNRVRSIDEMSATLHALVPDVRFRVGHGQMKATELENVMRGFIEHQFDVLVCTNIVESGLDVSNANTIIINHAQRFGLSDLHQLRGRVGRSDKKAFCYLLTSSVHTLTREGRQRLQAIEQFSDLGEGFNIAMRDLDIRGAGSMLGAEQSGFIEDVGFETYHKILDEAVNELRYQEFGDLFTDAPPPPGLETTVEIDEDALLPADFVSDPVERLSLYRRISEAETRTALDELRAELIDRFGPLPSEADFLLDAAQLKTLGQRLRLAKISYKNNRVFLHVPHVDDDAHFYDVEFQPLLQRLNGMKRRYVLKDTKGKLRIIIQNVNTLDAAIEVMRLASQPAAAVV